MDRKIINAHLLEKALSIALRAHKGQQDKAGKPYILHVLRVMMAVNKTDEKIVALLHDAIEDSNITFEDLEKESFPRFVIEAVKLLTKTNHQDYIEYIRNIQKNEIAKSVKISDLNDNMNLKRIKQLSDKDKLRMEKYKKALNILNPLK